MREPPFAGSLLAHLAKVACLGPGAAMLDITTGLAI